MIPGTEEHQRKVVATLGPLRYIPEWEKIIISSMLIPARYVPGASKQYVNFTKEVADGIFIERKPLERVNCTDERVKAVVYMDGVDYVRWAVIAWFAAVMGIFVVVCRDGCISRRENAADEFEASARFMNDAEEGEQLSYATIEIQRQRIV